MDDDYMFLPDLARDLGVEKTYARKYARSKGFEFVKIRGTGGQFSLAISREDARKLVAIRLSEFRAPDPGTIEGDCVYIIQLYPKHAPGLVKVGYSRCLRRRIVDLRVVAPQAIVCRAWPVSTCRARPLATRPLIEAHEQAALEAVRGAGESLGGEVFFVESLDNAIDVISSALLGT